jgi:hypothetical protein
MMMTECAEPIRRVRRKTMKHEYFNRRAELRFRDEQVKIPQISISRIDVHPRRNIRSALQQNWLNACFVKKNYGRFQLSQDCGVALAIERFDSRHEIRNLGRYERTRPQLTYVAVESRQHRLLVGSLKQLRPIPVVITDGGESSLAIKAKTRTQELMVWISHYLAGIWTHPGEHTHFTTCSRSHPS